MAHYYVNDDGSISKGNKKNKKINEYIVGDDGTITLKQEIAPVKQTNMSTQNNTVTTNTKTELSPTINTANSDGYIDTGKKYGDYWYQGYSTNKDQKIYSKDGKYYLGRTKSDGTISYQDVDTINFMTTKDADRKEYKDAVKAGYKGSKSTVTHISDKIKLDTSNLSDEEYKDYDSDLKRQEIASDKELKHKNQVKYGGAGFKGSLGTLKTYASNIGNTADKEIISPIKNFKDNYETGKLNNELALEAYNKMEGKENKYDEMKKKVDTYNSFNQDLLTNPGAAGTAIQNLNTQVESLKHQGVTATILGVAGAAIGGTFGGVQGATTGLKAGGTLGYTFGATPYTYKLEAGNQYQTLTEMGVPDDVAKKYSRITGGINAGIESGENIIDLVTLGITSAAGKGSTVVSKKAVNEMVDEYGESQVKTWLSKKLGEKTADKILKTSAVATTSYIQNIGSESLEEMSQEGTSIVNERLATKEAGIERKATLKDDISRIIEAGKSAAITTAFTAPLSSVGGAIVTNTVNSVEAKIKNKKISSTELNNTIIDQIVKQDNNLSTEEIQQIQSEVYKTLDNKNIKIEEDPYTAMGKEIENDQQSTNRINNTTTQETKANSLIEAPSNTLNNVNNEAFLYIPNKKDSSYKATLYNSASELMNNSEKAHKLADALATIANDTKTYYEFTNNERLSASNENIKDKVINGLVRVNENGKQTVLVNLDSDKALNVIVGHETTHLLEGTKEYQELQKVIFNYAKEKGDFDSRRKSISELYDGIENVNVDSEITADLVGDYLFTDEKFVNSLSIQKPTLFQKIKNLIDDLITKFKGTKEEKQLRKVQKKFREAYKNTLEANNRKSGVKYSIIGIKNIDKALNNKNVDNNTKNSLNNVKNNYFKALAKEGKESNESIRIETGWFKDRNGDWKFEITDKYSKLKMIPTPNKTYKLGDILDHKLLYDVNPEIKNLKVKFRDLEDVKGQYLNLPVIDSIRINNSLLQKGENEIRSTLLHEIQHYNQRFNKFEQGMSSGKSLEDMIKYVNSLGEIEAKNVQERMNLSKDELKTTAPTSSKENPVHPQAELLIEKRKREIANKSKKVYNEFRGMFNEEDIEKTNGKNREFSIQTLGNGSEELDNSSFSFGENDKNTKNSISEKDSLEKRVSGDALIDAQDLIEEVKSVGANVDENGYITVYHQTTNENAEKIKQTGKMSAKEPYVYFSTSQNAQQSENRGTSKLEFKIPAEKLVLDDIFSDNADVKIPLKGSKTLNVSNYLVNDINNLKNEQYKIIENSNPVEDEYHTWIRSTDDIKTFDETLNDPDWADYREEGFDPDYTGDIINEALETGKITVYSSYPIEQGIFVTPSQMEAETYSGNGKVYSKEVNLTDVAWIDPTQGQYAKVYNYSLSNQNEQIAPVGNFNIYGKEVKLQVEKQLEEAISPIKQELKTAKQELSKTINEVKGSLEEFKSLTKKESTYSDPVLSYVENLIERKNIKEKARESAKAESERIKAAQQEQARLDKASRENTIKSKVTTAWDTFQSQFVNRNRQLDKLSKETGNREIKFKADRMNNISGEIGGDIFTAQTDNYGNAIGKSLDAPFAAAREQGLEQYFDNYLKHQSNIERHEQGKGSKVSAEISKQYVQAYEAKYPVLKDLAQDVYTYNQNMLNNAVENGLIDAEFRDKLNNMYGKYVPFYENNKEATPSIDMSPDEIIGSRPIKRAKGGTDTDLLSIEQAMIKQTYSWKNAIAKNDLYKEVVNSMNNTVDIGADIRENPTTLSDSLYADESGKYLTAYVDGQQKTVQVSEALYKELNRDLEHQIKEIEDKYSIITKPIQKISQIRGQILTTYNPGFILTNPFKDIQDALLNTKNLKGYAKDLLSTFPDSKKAKNLNEYATKFNQITGQDITSVSNPENLTGQAKKLYKNYQDGQMWNRFITSYGTNATNMEYSDSNISVKAKNKGFLNKIANANDYMEVMFRYPEFKQTIKNGGSFTEALYNAREVTTNFGRGGTISKAINRNGATFYNTSIQGLDKFIRNFSGENGARGFVGAVSKALILGMVPAVLNHLILGGDDDYEDLPKYIKDNYYLFKTGDGAFIRVPKGRMVSVLGSAARRTLEAVEGEKNAFDGYLENASSQIGSTNPLKENILSPLIQAYGSENGEAWYGGDLVPKRLQNKPAAEQYDESTDELSKLIGKTFNISPYKLNYVIDQYTGGVGDATLPMMTKETTSDEEGAGMLLAPIKDKFVVNSIDDNKYAGELYDTSDKLTKKANSEKASNEDLIKNKYINSVKSEMNELYKKKREIQNSNLSRKEKYNQVQEIQSQINALSKEALNTYEKVEATDYYAKVGDKEFYKNNKNEWTTLNSKEADAISTLSTEDKNYYFETKDEITSIRSDKKSPSNTKKYDIINALIDSDLSDEGKAYLYSRYYDDEKKVTNIVNSGTSMNNYLKYEQMTDGMTSLGKEKYLLDSGLNNASKQAIYEFDVLGDIEDTDYEVAKNFGIGINEWLKFNLQNFESDKKANGKTVSGSRKAKVMNYIESLNLTVTQKALLTKLEYTSFNTYNTQILQYIDTMKLTEADKRALYKKLGFSYSNGTVRW